MDTPTFIAFITALATLIGALSPIIVTLIQSKKDKSKNASGILLPDNVKLHSPKPQIRWGIVLIFAFLCGFAGYGAVTLASLKPSTISDVTIPPSTTTSLFPTATFQIHPTLTTQPSLLPLPVTTQATSLDLSKGFDQHISWIFLNFEENYNCFVINSEGSTGTLMTITSDTGMALQLTYDLGNSSGNWSQIRCEFDPPLDLSAFDHFRFNWHGDPNAANSLNVGLINPSVTNQEYIFARGYPHLTHQAWWAQLIIPFKFLSPWNNGEILNPNQVSGIFIDVVKDRYDDVGGKGSITIDNLSAVNIGSRNIPADFETVKGNIAAANAAVNWIASRQTSTGLLQSWEETSCNAWLHDQAMALIIFSHEEMWTKAYQLLDTLVAKQDENGAWANGYDCSTQKELSDDRRWEGSVAWMIYALNYYTGKGGSHPQAIASAQRAIDWLVTRIDPADHCLIINHAQGTIAAWWALRSAGAKYADDAAGLENCLLTKYWDEELGSLKAGQDWPDYYLDNQTLGAAFLKAIGENEKALRALSYAKETLWLTAQDGKTFLLPAQSGQLSGLGSQAGSGSIWNEGVGQYIAVGGEGANELLTELLAQQRSDGALPGSPDEFVGLTVWMTRSAGISPTAWLFFALCGGPFTPPVSGGC